MFSNNMTLDSFKDMDFFNRMAKELSLELHHEAQLHNIVEIIEKKFSLVWLDGFNEGFQQGRRELEQSWELAEPLPLSLDSDSTGEP